MENNYPEKEIFVRNYKDEIIEDIINMTDKDIIIPKTGMKIWGQNPIKPLKIEDDN